MIAWRDICCACVCRILNDDNSASSFTNLVSSVQYNLGDYDVRTCNFLVAPLAAARRDSSSHVSVSDKKHWEEPQSIVVK